MNVAWVRGAAGCALLLLSGSFSFMQADDHHDQPGSSDSPIQIAPGRLNRLSDSDARRSLNGENTAGGASTFSFRGSAALGLPAWTYSVKSSRDGRTYTGQVVGQNPATGGQTIVPTYVIPVQLVFRYSSTTSYIFDPTAADPGCLGAGNTALSLTQASPIFTDYPFTLVSSGDDSTQYADHFNRANFWNNISASKLPTYHTLLGGPIVEPVQTVTVNASNGFFANGTVYSIGGVCGTNTGNTNHAGFLGIMNINSWDPVARSLISRLGLNSTDLPLFVFYNAVLSQGSSANLNNCCILGYHNATGSPVQTYAVAEFEGRNQTIFSGVADVAAMSHEINEWMQDPGGSNSSPAWGNVGQVSGCQNDYEVGDPLSGTLLPGIIGSNGFTYHLQELAFFSWFYGGPSIGINGWFSDNGAFKIQAATCPPGGA